MSDRGGNNAWYDSYTDWSPTYYSHIILILLSCFSGFIIGYERKSKHKQAGRKTHILVALTATLMMILSKEAFLDTPNYDTSRVAAQIVSGISFIGGGIIFMRDKKISGITTAAGIWATAGIGMAIGSGFAFLGLFCSLIVVLVQKSSSIFLKSDNHYHIRMTGFVTNKPSIDTLNILIEQKGFYNLNIDMDRNEIGYNLAIRADHDKSISYKNMAEVLWKCDENFYINQVKIVSLEG